MHSMLENLTLNSKIFYRVLSALQGKKNSYMCKLEKLWVFYIIDSMVLGSSQHKKVHDALGCHYKDNVILPILSWQHSGILSMNTDAYS